MTPLQVASHVKRSIVTGAVASAASALFIVAAGTLRTGSPAAGINAESHALRGRSAFRELRPSLRYTLTGLAVHHVAALWWAGIHESPRLRAFMPGAGPRAALVMAAALVLDYGVLPRRLTPGLESHFSRRGIVATFAALAAGLAIGSRLQDRPVRLRAATARRLIDETGLPETMRAERSAPAEVAHRYH